MNIPEPDDHLHNPDPKRDRHYDSGGHIFTSRGIANLGCLFILAAGMMMLLFALPSPPSCRGPCSFSPFIVLSAGYPVYSHFTRKRPDNTGRVQPWAAQTLPAKFPRSPTTLVLLILQHPRVRTLSRRSRTPTSSGILSSLTSSTSTDELSTLGMTLIGRQSICITGKP
jgi:hypothetical protein